MEIGEWLYSSKKGEQIVILSAAKDPDRLPLAGWRSFTPFRMTDCDHFAAASASNITSTGAFLPVASSKPTTPW
jgi:hypothetical protein